MNHTTGLQTLAFNYTEQRSQTCVHIIPMNSQLLLLSGNEHTAIAVHTDTHGKETGESICVTCMRPGLPDTTDCRMHRNPAGLGLQKSSQNVLKRKRDNEGKKFHETAAER